jgi:hypothetical protein
MKAERKVSNKINWRRNSLLNPGPGKEVGYNAKPPGQIEGH